MGRLFDAATTRSVTCLLAILAVLLTLSGQMRAEQVWTKIDSGPVPEKGSWVSLFPSLNAVTVLPDGKTVIGVGGTGTLLRSGDSGQSWAPTDTGTDQDLNGVVTLSNGTTVIAVGSRGMVLRSEDAGRSWNPVSAVTLQRLN